MSKPSYTWIYFDVSQQRDLTSFKRPLKINMEIFPFSPRFLLCSFEKKKTKMPSPSRDKTLICLDWLWSRVRQRERDWRRRETVKDIVPCSRSLGLRQSQRNSWCPQTLETQENMHNVFVAISHLQKIKQDLFPEFVDTLQVQTKTVWKIPHA